MSKGEEREQAPEGALRAALERLPDVRRGHGKVHPLGGMRALAVCAVWGGCRSLYAISQWGRECEPAIRVALGLRAERGPRVATLHRAFRHRDHPAFERVLALVVTPANEQERAQVARLAVAVQEATGDHVELADVDQGYTGEQPEQDAAAVGIRLDVVKRPEAKRGFVLLPKRWVVERSFAWTARFRRLARDDERLPATLAGLHFVAVACLMLHRLFQFFSSPSGSCNYEGWGVSCRA